MARSPDRGGTGFGGLTTALSIAAVAIGGVVLHLTAARRAAGELGLPLDDAWIHARLARNLVRGAGFVFNPGEPSAASSAPLWTLLLAAPAGLGIRFPYASYAAGAVLLLVAAGLAARIVEGVTGDRGLAAAAGLLMVCTHPFPWLAVSGMEGGLAAALVLGTLLQCSRRRTGAALSLAAAAALARPELIVLPGFVALDRALGRRGTGPDGASRTPPFRAAAIGLAAIAATAAPLLVHRALTGFWVPGSLAAKVGRHGVLAALAEGRPDRVPAILAANLPLTAGPYLLALARDNAALLAAAPLGFLLQARGAAGTHLPWLLALLQPLLAGVLAPFGGPDFHEQRYMAHLVALVLVAGCAGLAALPGWRRHAALRAAALAATVALSLAGAWRGVGRYAVEVKNITEMQVRVGRWLAARPGPPRRVATNDIGAIGDLTGADIVDLTGLATPDAIPYLRRPYPPGLRSSGWNGANQAALLEFLEARRPEYVAIFPSWYPAPFFGEALSPAVLRVDLDDNLICGDRTMIVYRPVWGRGSYNRPEGGPPGGAPGPGN